jgi:hypothetical protein
MTSRLAPFSLLALSLSAVSAMTLGCGAAPEGATDDDVDVATEGHGRDAIVGGTAATGYPEAALVNMFQNGAQVAICSGAVIAPQVVLTAGHCVVGLNGWSVKTPYAGGQSAVASGAATYDYNSTAEYVDATKHDVALVFLKTPIKLSSYPTVAKAKSANGTKIVNLGRIKDGVASYSNLYVSPVITVNDAASYGFPYDYIATEKIESGDSGGPDIIAGTHTILAVNSGGGGGTEVLARVDLVYDWIQQQIASHGGSGTSTGGTTGSGGSTGTGGSTGGTTTPSCAHPLCASGTRLSSSCDPCATKICAADSYCCTNAWDDICVGEVTSICGATCQ